MNAISSQMKQLIHQFISSLWSAPMFSSEAPVSLTGKTSFLYVNKA